MTILGGLLKGGVTGQTETSSLHSQFMIAVSSYIGGNVKFSGTFSGANSMGIPLVTSIVCDVDPRGLASENSGCADPEGGDGYSQWLDWISGVYSFISNDCVLKPGVFIPSSPTPCFKLVKPITWDRVDLENAIKGKEKSPQEPCLDRIATGFMDDMKIDFVSTFPGKVSDFTGALTVSNVITP